MAGDDGERCDVLEPVEPILQRVEMIACRAFRHFFQAIERCPVLGGCSDEQGIEACRERWGYLAGNAMDNEQVDERADALDHGVKRAERWEFDARFPERLNGDIDQIDGPVHGLCRLVDGRGKDMPPLPAVRQQVEVGADGLVMITEGTLRVILEGTRRIELEHRAQMIDNRAGDLFWLREVAQLLHDLEQDDHVERVFGQAGRLLYEVPFVRRGRKGVSEFAGADRPLETGIGRPLNGCHTVPP